MSRSTLLIALGDLGAAIQAREDRRLARMQRRVWARTRQPAAAAPARAPAPLAAVPSCPKCDTPATGDGSRWWCSECTIPVTLPRL